MTVDRRANFQRAYANARRGETLECAGVLLIGAVILGVVFDPALATTYPIETVELGAAVGLAGTATILRGIHLGKEYKSRVPTMDAPTVTPAPAVRTILGELARFNPLRLGRRTPES